MFLFVFLLFSAGTNIYLHFYAQKEVDITLNKDYSVIFTSKTIRINADDRQLGVRAEALHEPGPKTGPVRWPEPRPPREDGYENP